MVQPVEQLRLRELIELIVDKALSRRGRPFMQATVQSVQTGPPHSLTVQVEGSSVNVPGVRYLASYSPTVGDTVWCALIDGRDLLVLGVLAA